MAQVYPIFTSSTGPKKSFHGCLNFRAVFEIDNPGLGYVAAITEFLRYNSLNPGLYLILEATKSDAKGMVFTINDDGTLQQGVPEPAPIMTRWPPKS